MVHNLGLGTLYDAFDLPVLSDVAAQVSSRRVLLQVANPDLVIILLKPAH